MPPKSGMTQVQKLEKILNYFRESATCHTLKDLEKSVPTATKVNKMQVKDLLQELIDTNQVNVEKIGSGNWYWAWAGDEVNEKKNIIAKLQIEHDILNASILDMQTRLDQMRVDQSTLSSDACFQRALAQLGPLEGKVKDLSTEKDEWETAIAGGVEGQIAEIERLKLDATQSTNDIYTLQNKVEKLAELDRYGMDQLRMNCYGDSFVSGEDLGDIGDI